jgi:hypothetical protein
MQRIYQIERIIANNQQFSKNCYRDFKFETIKAQLQKKIAIKKEKMKSSRLLRELHEE